EIEIFTVIFPSHLCKRHNLFYRVGLISNDKIASPRIQEVLKYAAFVAILVVKGVTLGFTNPNFGKTPNFRVSIQPPISDCVRLTAKQQIQCQVKIWFQNQLFK